MTDPLRPSDHADSTADSASDEVTQPRLGVVGWLRWGWRQLTSMRTALVLLLLLAIAAVPGSLVPQRSADPNGVTQYFTDNPDLAPVLDNLSLFEFYHRHLNGNPFIKNFPCGTLSLIPDTIFCSRLGPSNVFHHHVETLFPFSRQAKNNSRSIHISDYLECDTF